MIRHQIDQDTVWVYAPFKNGDHVTFWRYGIGPYRDYPDYHSFLKSRLKANRHDLNKLADEMDMTPDNLLEVLLDGADGVPDAIEDLVIECYHGERGEEQ